MVRLMAARAVGEGRWISAARRAMAVVRQRSTRAWCGGLDMEILQREPVCCRCDCSREKMEKALIALGRKELQQMMDEDGGAELTCHFCRTAHRFTRGDLEDLLARATR